MLYWQWFWTVLWFGGLVVFGLLSVVITIQGARDLGALLRGLRSEDSPDRPELR